MPKTRIPSPARSQGATTTPRRKKTRSSRSLCSPALSTASGRLTSLIDQFKDKNMESFALSPLNGRSVLNDNTDIDEPRRKSWWKKLDENSRDVIEVLEDNKLTDANNVVEEFIDIEILSQEKKNYTLDLPESSDNESINSIVLPQRRLFTQKENLPQKKFGKLIDNRESLAKLHKPNTTNIEKVVNVGTREIFQNAKRSKPIFPAALLNISPNKTVADKTKENVLQEPKPQVRNIFGNRPATKRKNMFADFIVSESEDEIPEIQPKVFGFQKKLEQRRISSVSKGRDGSPTSSITTDMEMDDWKLLPSSTMVENQLEDMMGGNTPVKRARLSKLSEAKESDAGTNTLQTNTTADKTKQSNNSATSKNKSKASPEIKDKSLNNSRTTRSMLKNASKVEDNANTSLKQDSKANKSQNRRSPKGDSDKSPQNDKQDISLNKSQKLNKSKTRNSQNVVENKIETDETISNPVNIINNITRVINKSTGKNISSSTVPNKSVNEKERTVTLKVHDQPGTDDVEQNDQDDDENNFTLEYENDENEILEQAVDHNDLAENQKHNKKQNTTTLYNDNPETKINKSKNNKSSLLNKSIQNQKETKPAKTVEESVESQNGHYSANDNVDGNLVQEPETVHNETEENAEANVDEVSKLNVAEESQNDDEDKISQDNEENQNVSQEEANESHEVDNEENESDEEEEEAVDSDENEDEANASDLNEDDANGSQEVEAEVNESQDIEEEENESQEIDNQANESLIEEDNLASEIEDEDREKTANESQAEASANVSKEVQSEEDSSEDENEEDNQEDENDDEESKEIENDAEVSEEVENDEEESQEVENDEQESEDNENDEEENQELESDAEVNESEEIDNDQQMEDSDEADKAIASDPENSEQDDDDQADEMEVDDDNVNEQESDNEHDKSHQEHPEEIEEQNEVEPSAEEIGESPDVTHDTTGRHRNKHLNKSPEVILHDKTNHVDSFAATGRNTSIRKTKSMIKNLHIRPSLAPARNSTGFSDGVTNSSAEGSGWDSHRTTRKTLRQTFGKDFTPRKSLRAMVMEKSAKRQTEHIDTHSETVKFPQANSTELPETSNRDVEDFVESDHEVSRRTRQTTLEMYLQKIKQQNIEKKNKMEELVRNSLNKGPVRDPMSLFKVPNKPAPRRVKPTQMKPKKQIKSLIAFDDLPSEVKEDMKYKPPKRFTPSNASWVTKRLYKYLETKLEPKYDYKARIRSEKLVETIYHFAKDLRRHTVAPADAVDVLKHELARLEIVNTHFEFYEFFHEFMPREVRIKVVPDIVNKIPLPRHGVFSEILRGNTVQG